MDISELQKLAQHTRFMRETGMALLIGSAVLGLFIFVPFGPKQTTATTVVASTTPDAYTKVTIEAKAGIVYDLTTKKILYAKNSDAQLPLASLTKLLTVYAALAKLAPSTEIVIPAEVTTLDLPRAFNEDQVFTLSDLARLTLTASLNDGAAAIATATAAFEESSQRQMLASAAAALDLTQTYAVNGSGLDESTALSGGYGSARDLAVLAGALVAQAPRIALATTEATASAVSLGGTEYTVNNTDPIIDTIPGLMLSKTGFTDLAGGNLALVFDAGIGHPIAVVVLGSSQKSRFTDGYALVSATLEHFGANESL
ncbi:MAG: hypothetical protein JWN18_576 [Parcubacteria group bacterium]|nr:hypothetical protein [Parcubacteria group bacterium]